MGKNKGDVGGGEKKTASVTVVLKVDIHCHGCASKILKHVRSFQGVETVKAESKTGKVTVTGDVDPAKLREQLEVKIEKKVELVSPQPKKEKEKDNNKDKNTSNEDKTKEKKTEEKKPKEAPVTTVVLKLKFHCQVCIEKIQKILTETKGVSGLSMDNEKELVTVKGTMNVKKLVKSLTEKLERNVEIVQPAKKEKENGNAKENESGDKKKGGGGNGGGKDSAGNKGGEGVNTMEYDLGGDGDKILGLSRLFSDDNPNACVVM